MIFDALRRIAGNWLADIKPLVDAATLLHIPVTPHLVLPRRQDLQTMSRVSVNFRLPHQITAIEDNASCVLLIDPRPDLRGMDEERIFVECVPLNGDESHYNDSPIERAVCQAFGSKIADEVYGISLGKFSSPAQRAGSWLARGHVLWLVTGTVTEPHTTRDDFAALPDAALELLTNSTLRNVMTAIEEIIALAPVSS